MRRFSLGWPDMLRLIYTLLLALATPLIVGRLWWRGRKEAGYRQYIGERFGRYPQPPLKNAIWIHAVSVGEVRAALPLIAACEKQFPQQPILITCMTPTGRAMANELFANRAAIAYLPYDFPFAMQRLLAHFKPSCLLIMETEIWFSLVAVCHQAHVPVLLVNGRLSERSRAGYAKLAPIHLLTREALGNMTVVAAQSAADAARFSSLGARNVVVTGNLKFDLTPDAEIVARGNAWRAAIPASKQHVLLAASTRESEEAMLLEAYLTVFDAAARSEILLVIVPRHPQRFDDVFQLIQKNDLWVIRRSHAATLNANIQVWLGDSMGEMAAYYALCDVAIIGGSFAPLGGQNLIEAAALGKPIIVGPHVFNFSDAVRLAKDAGALTQVADAEAAMRAAQLLFNDTSAQQQMGQAAQKFAEAHRGATTKTMGLIARAMNPMR